jgi:hemolysin III
MEAAFPLKPRFRGVVHQWSFFVALAAGAALVAWAPAGRATAASAVYAVALAGLLGTSALYHRITWQPRARAWLRRLDHSMIFVLIAGSYTPVTLLALHPGWGITLLVLAWVGAATGVLVTVVHLERWPNLGFVMYIVLGWLAIVAGPQLVRSLSRVELALLVGGGILYTVGALVLARKRPDPRPHVFGYHEVWHSFTLGAGVAHFALVLMLVRA